MATAMSVPRKLVCAIDYGTTYSGYAYGKEGTIDGVVLNPEWGNELGLPSFKTSTTVLTDRNGLFHAFGFMAENKYSQFCAMNDAEGFDLYKHFKMLLHNEKDLTRHTQVTSTRGTTRPAIDIFTMALQYFKDEIMQDATDRYGSDHKLEHIQWVITVPAIWSEKAKQFMREAAFQAKLITDISSDSLMFALEPEAAAIYCQQLNIDKYHGTDEAVKQGLNFTVGTKYMIIDAGGGTVDIATQEVLPDRKVKELESPSGGAWGGKTINEKFEELMATIFGQEFIQAYKQKKPNAWLLLEMEFEKKKRANRPDGESMIILPINRSFERFHREETGNELDEVIGKYADLGIYVRDDDIVINPSRIFDFYHSVFSSLIPHIVKLLEKPKLEGLKHIFLIGGFAESDYMKKAMSSAFLDYVVLTPQNSGTAVLRGAVIYGHNPEIIISRIAKKSYGLRKNIRFDKDSHQEDKQILDENGIAFCKDVFHQFVCVGDEVTIGESNKHMFKPFSSTAMTCNTSLYESENSNPTYVDEPNTRELAKIDIIMIDTTGGKDRDIEVNVYFGRTEIQVEASDARGGKVVKAKIDFLTEDIPSPGLSDIVCEDKSVP